MKTVRCKFQLSEVTEFTYGRRRYTFTPQYDTTIDEDRRFAKASPSGKFEIHVDNPAVFDVFKVGKFYYFDAYPVEAAAPATTTPATTTPAA